MSDNSNIVSAIGGPAGIVYSDTGGQGGIGYGDPTAVPVKPGPYSTNNKLIVEAYKNEGLQAETKNGFAMVGQKVKAKGLRLLIDAKLSDGTIIKAGTMVYIEEAILMGPAGKKILEADILKVPFLKIDISHVEFFVG